MPESVCFSMILGNALGRSLSLSSNSSWCICFREPKKAAEIFAEDGAFELPYLATFGLPTECKGRDAIAGFFQSVLDIYPGFQFENTKVLIDTPDQVFAEFEATAVSSKTGRTVHQLFFSRLVAKNGKIKLFREALNTFEVARAN